MAVALRSGNQSTPAMLVTIGNGGGIVLPWLQGRILVDGGTRAGTGMSAVLCAGMLGVALLARRRPASRSAAAVQ
jgi:hypothetical protein